MNNQNLQKYIKNVGQFFANAGNNVYFDWSVILGFFCITAVVLMIMSAELFFSINAGTSAAGQASVATASQGSADQALDTADLNNVISIFQSKNADMSIFVSTYPGPSDPAVPMKFTSVPTKLSSTTQIQPPAK